MSREVVLYCTDRGQHGRVDVYTMSLPNDVEPGEPVRWSPVFRGETLTLTCPDPNCVRAPRLSRRNGGPLLGELERQSRLAQRVEFDISYLPF